MRFIRFRALVVECARCLKRPQNDGDGRHRPVQGERPSSQRPLESPWEGKLKQESRNLKLQKDGAGPLLGPSEAWPPKAPLEVIVSSQIETLTQECSMINGCSSLDEDLSDEAGVTAGRTGSCRRRGRPQEHSKKALKREYLPSCGKPLLLAPSNMENSSRPVQHLGLSHYTSHRCTERCCTRCPFNS